MIDLGYIAKRIVPRPDWLKVDSVRSVWSVSNCMSPAFCEFIPHWKHNGYWFFDAPALVREVAKLEGVSLDDAELVYLRAHNRQYDRRRQAWSTFSAEASFKTKVAPPESMALRGYDIVTYSTGSGPDCSPLSCNHVASDVCVNEYCLFGSMAYAIEQLESGVFDNAEPGSCRVIEVNAVEWPPDQ